MSPRLLWIHQNYVHHSQAGNARAGFLLRALTDAGWQVDLVAGTSSYFGDTAVEGVTIEHNGALRIHRVPSGTGAKRSQYATFTRNATMRAIHMPRPDVIFGSTPPLPQLAASLALSAWWQAPLVLEVRDVWPAFLLEGGLLQPGPVVTALRCLESTALRHSAEVVVVAPAFRPYAEGMGVDPRRITVVPTGAVLPQVLREDGAAWRSQNGLEGKILALYAGSFNEAYDLNVLLSAARSCSRRDIVWVFAGNGRGRPAIETAARECWNVVYLGSLPRSSMKAVLGAADIALLPHADWPLLSMTISGKLFEYMAYELAVVCLRDGTMGEIVRDAGCGVVLRTPTADALRDAVEALASDPIRATVGSRGSAWVRQNAEARQMAGSIREVVERCQPGPQRRRLLCAAFGGLADGARGRAEAVLSEAIRTDPQRVAFDTLAAWLKEKEVPHE